MRETTCRFLSLGAGTQSTVLALLLSKSDPRLLELGYCRPDAAIFADTGWEPKYVYQHLDWLEKQLDYPLVRVSGGDLRTNLKNGRTISGHRFFNVPFFTISENGKKGMLRRQCTNQYKVQPINTAVRRLAGVERGHRFPNDARAEMWLGISLDEVSRMKPSREPWIKNRWPLVDLRMSRQDCIAWFANEYPERYLPRSACVICPYRSDAHWLELKRSEPTSYNEAVEFDGWLRTEGRQVLDSRLADTLFLHSSRQPIDQALTEGQANRAFAFMDECTGLCGV